LFAEILPRLEKKKTGVFKPKSARVIYSDSGFDVLMCADIIKMRAIAPVSICAVLLLLVITSELTYADDKTDQLPGAGGSTKDDGIGLLLERLKMCSCIGQIIEFPVIFTSRKTSA
jgi:hypothetical protein